MAEWTPDNRNENNTSPVGGYPDRSEKVRYSCTDIPVGFFSGHHSAYANNSMPAHWHEDIELFVPYEGEAMYNINGNLVRVKAGEGILINSRRIHSSVTEGLRDCYYNLLISDI